MGQSYRADDIAKPRAQGLNEAQRAFDYDQDEYSYQKYTRPQPPILPPHLSCAGGLTGRQKQATSLFCAAMGITGLFYPGLLLATSAAIFWIIFSVLILWRAALIAGGLAASFNWTEFVFFYESYLPIYTVMIAAYDEAPVMAQLARAMHAIDWPADKLDSLLLLEEDDATTLPAALRANFPRGTRILTVPDGLPRTKPRALNYGLARAKGDYVCIFDVEDRPHPKQLKSAYRRFRHAASDYACLQAPLIGANANRAWLAAHWSLEYAVQFRFLLPALAAIRAPIPIGGTSNHFDKAKLISAGGWDAFNVTEDADLGLRFARLRWQIGTIETGTLEDAPTSFRDWTTQRTRWIKGFMQTWLVLMKRPRQTARQMGWPNFAMMQLTLGGAILAPLAHGPFLIVLFAGMLFEQLSPGIAGWALLFTGWLITLVGDALAPGVPRRARWFAALTRPLYWPLHSIAAWIALSEMVTKPHYWAKTPHEPSLDAEPECFTGYSR